MNKIEYGNIIGVFSENGQYRLDIGTDATKKNVPASHNSWSTRLRIQRLDGPSSGAVSEQHVVGIFSENGQYRLDIGTDAMKKNVPASHESWATRLRIQRLDGPSSGEVHYGEVVGIFSENGQYRLDIGTDAMKKNTPASHDSWATRLRIADRDPIVDVQITSLNYDVSHASLESSAPEQLDTVTLDNSTNVAQTLTLSFSKTLTETHGWSDTLGIKIGAKTTFSTGIPIVLNGNVEVSAEVSDTYTWNGSNATAETWGFQSPVNCPAHTTTVALITATHSNIRVPYSASVIFIRQSGAQEPGQISGTYVGTTSHDLMVTYEQKDTETGVVTTFTQVIADPKPKST